MHKKTTIILSIILLFSLFSACGEETGISNAIENPIISDPDYLNFFDPLKVHTINISFTTTEWSNLSNDLYSNKYSDSLGRDPYDIMFNTELNRKTTVDINGQIISDVGVRIRGNSSRYYPQDSAGFHWVHWKISFSQDFSENEGVYGSDDIVIPPKTTKKYFGVRGLNLKHAVNDPTGIKETVGYDIAKRFGLIVPGYTFAKVNIIINGVTNNYGLYQVIEPIDKQFVRLRFNGSSSYLFKCLWTVHGPANLADDSNYNKDVDIGLEVMDPTNSSQLATWNPNSYNDLGYSPSSINVNSPYRPTYDLKAKKTELTTARDMLDTLISGISSYSGSAFNSWLPTIFDVDSFLKSCALHALLGQWDDYCRNPNNYYLLWNRTTSKWVFIPYDLDHTFVDENGSKTQWEVSIINWIQNGAVLGQKVMANPAWADKYKQYVRNLIDSSGSLFTPTAVENRFLTLQTAIDAANIGTPVFDLSETAAYAGSSAVNTIKTYVTSRRLQAISEVGTNSSSGGYARNFSIIYIRGDLNSWGTTAMNLSADNTWTATVSMNNGDAFKFDDAEDWGPDDWGEDNQSGGSNSGTCEVGGDNILNNQPTGSVIVTFNDSTLAWSITTP